MRAVIVDIDDTLCLSEAVSFELENEVLSRLGRPPMPRELHLATWGLPLHEAMLARSPGIDLEAFAAVFGPIFKGYVADGRIDVITEANLAALDRLGAAGLTVMVLTSRALIEVEHLIAAEHPLARRLSAVYHAGNTRFRKPDPRVFDELLAASGLRPYQCVYIGDSPGDAAAAKGAGLRFIACLESGLRSRSDFEPYAVDCFIESFPGVVGAVSALAAKGYSLPGDR